MTDNITIKTLDQVKEIENIFIKEVNGRDTNYGLILKADNIRTILECRELMNKAYALMEEHEGEAAKEMMQRHISPYKEIACKYHAADVHIGTGNIRYIRFSDYGDEIDFFDTDLEQVVLSILKAASSKDGVCLDDRSGILSAIDGNNAFVWNLGWLDYEEDGIGEAYVEEAFRADEYDGVMRASEEMLKDLKEKVQRFVKDYNAKVEQAA